MRFARNEAPILGLPVVIGVAKGGQGRAFAQPSLIFAQPSKFFVKISNYSSYLTVHFSHIIIVLAWQLHTI